MTQANARSEAAKPPRTVVQERTGVRLLSSALDASKSEIGKSTAAAARRSGILLAISASAVCYAVYLAIKPVQWGDSGYFIGEFVSGELTFKGQIAHPGYKIIAGAVYKLCGINALFVLNAVSNAFSSCVIFKAAQRLGATTWSAWIGASAFFVSQPAFWLATNMEVYPLHNAVLLFGVYLVLRGQDLSASTRWRPFIGGSALIATSIVFHQLSALLLPPLALDTFQRLRRSPKTEGIGRPPRLFAILAVALVLAAAAAIVASGHLAWVAEYFGVPGVGQGWSAKYFQIGAISRDPKYFFMAVYGLGFLIIAIALPSRGDGRVRFLKIAAALQLAFVLTYDIPDRFQFLLPALSFLSILFALLLDKIGKTGRSVLASAAILFPIFIGALVYGAILPEDLFPRHYRTNAYRNDVSYFLSPYFKETSAALFIDDLNQIARAHPDTVVTLLADEWTPKEALVSAHATGYARGIEMALTKDLGVGADGCPSSPPDRLYIVFRRNDIAPMEERCLRQLGRLFAVRD
jgi:hypothetical protein